MILSLRKIFIVALLFILVHVSINAQTRFNFFAGPQVTTVSYVVKGEKQATSFKPGVVLGAGAKIEFENRLFFSPSIYYSLKGYKVDFKQSSMLPNPSALNNNVTVHTLETAFLLQYDFNKKPSHLFIKLGPSIDFQLYGKEKFDLADETHVDRTMKYDYENYGRYAATGVFQLGYELRKSIFFYGYYEQGLTNLDNADKGPTIQYRVAGITIGKFIK
ncbi:MAG: porin family protein [Chitinophagaceae bacterium]